MRFLFFFFGFFSEELILKLQSDVFELTTQALNIPSDQSARTPGNTSRFVEGGCGASWKRLCLEDTTSRL